MFKMILQTKIDTFNSYLDVTKLEFRDAAELIPSKFPKTREVFKIDLNIENYIFEAEFF